MPLETDEKLTLFEHLDELRRRAFVAAAAIAVGVVVAAIFNSFVFKVLLWPLNQVHGLPATAYKITTFSPAEPFMVSLKVWLVAGIVLASPVLIWEFWAFVGPAFSPREKRYFYPIVGATTGLFLGGVMLAYFVVLPKGLQWLLGFGAGNFNIQNRASDYFTFVALFVLAFGAVFELPVILVLLARVGVIDDKFLRRHRSYAIVILAVVSAVITPSQDAFSMLAMLIPLVILYEVSIHLSRLVQPKKQVVVPAEAPGDDTPDDLGPAPA